LCTDQPEKLPRQLAMRAHQISLGLVSDEDLKDLLLWILQEEDVSLGTKQDLILKRIITASYGIPRQAVQLLDLVSTSLAGGAKASEALAMAVKTGSTADSFATSLKLIEALIDGDQDAAIKTICENTSEGVTELILRMLSSLIFRASGNNPKDGFGFATVKNYRGEVDLNKFLQLQKLVITAVHLRMSSNFAISTEAALLSLIERRQ
jgi:DNA polymerase III gamma/tau subunit